ncbi:hypothetical protein D3C87_583620 [compost metagenome]
MSIYKIDPLVAYDHDQGAFMFYGDGLRMIPSHYVSRFEVGENELVVVCDTKYLKETIHFECNDPVSLCEKLTVLLEDF